MTEVETVMKHCKHPDCMYRGHFDGDVRCCHYMLITGHSRGCSISACDKYRPGTIKTISRLGGVHYDIKEDDQQRRD